MSEGNLRQGKVIDGRFVLERRLGAGSSGVVWAARDEVVGGLVALKLLHPPLGREPGLVGQLAREARVLQRMHHPNVARAIAFSGDGEFVHLAMELLEGSPLHEVIGARTRSGAPFSNRVLSRLMVQICAGVAHAHGEGIIHRDLKPQNVMVIDPEGERPDAKVLDFGIARLAPGSLFDATTLGRRMGSLFYMSPEQTRGEPVDARADVYALGTILFELLTLRRAWAWGPHGPLPAFDKPVGHAEINSVPRVFERAATSPRPRPRQWRPELPPSFDVIVQRAMAIDREARYPSVAAFANEARAALDVLTGGMAAAPTTEDDGPTVRPSEALSEELTAAPEPDADLLGADDLATDRRATPMVAPTLAFEAAAPDDRLRNVPVTASDEEQVRLPEPKSLALPPAPAAQARTVALDAPTSLEHSATLSEANEEPKTRPLPAAPTRPSPAAADAAPTAFLDATDDRPPPPPGFSDTLEEAGPTVRESRPVSAAVPARAMDTATTTGGSPRRRVGLALGLLGGALIGALLIVALNGGIAPQPAPVQVPSKPDPMPKLDPMPKPDPMPVAEAPRHAGLVALLSKVKSDPSDEATMAELVQGILQAADALEDPEARDEIREIATLSSTVKNVEGLASCVARLEALAP